MYSSMSYHKVNTPKGGCLDDGRNVSILVMDTGEGETDDPVIREPCARVDEKG